MDFEESEETPDPDPREAAAERLGVPLDDALRRLLAEEGDPQRPDPVPARAESREGERMVSVRVAPERFQVLAAVAAREGVSPTTMARLLLNRALREAEHDGFGA
jgi:antitoxin component of RelBE/YafQ-DinJ toxin-antitoxin module